VNRSRDYSGIFECSTSGLCMELRKTDKMLPPSLCSAQRNEGSVPIPGNIQPTVIYGASVILAFTHLDSECPAYICRIIITSWMGSSAVYILANSQNLGIGSAYGYGAKSRPILRYSLTFLLLCDKNIRFRHKIYTNYRLYRLPRHIK